MLVLALTFSTEKQQKAAFTMFNSPKGGTVIETIFGSLFDSCQRWPKDGAWIRFWTIFEQFFRSCDSHRNAHDLFLMFAPFLNAFLIMFGWFVWWWLNDLSMIFVLLFNEIWKIFGWFDMMSCNYQTIWNYLFAFYLLSICVCCLHVFLWFMYDLLVDLFRYA